MTRVPRMRADVADVVAAGALIGMVVAGSALLADLVPEPTAPGVRPVGEHGRRAGDGLALASYGTTESYAHVRLFEEVERLGYLSDNEIDMYRRGGASTARIMIAPELDEGKLIVLVVRQRDPSAARATADELTRGQVDAGMQRFSGYSIPVVVHDSAPGVGDIVRAHYVAGDVIVRLQLNAAPERDAAAAFGTVLRRQLEALPPDA